MNKHAPRTLRIVIPDIPHHLANTLYGGNGNDTTSGNDVYNETSGTESIVLTGSYTQGGTQYFRAANAPFVHGIRKCA